MDNKERKMSPELRFNGFYDDWEQCKLIDNAKEILDYRGKSPEKFGMNWTDEGYLVLSSLNVKDGYIDKNIEAKYADQSLFEYWMKDNKLEKGDVLFTTEAPLGNVAQIPDNEGYVLNQRVVAFKTDNTKTNNNFLANLLKSPLVQSKLNAKSTGGTAKGIGMKEFSKISSLIPIEVSEQTKIGNLFSSLDHLIALHQCKLNNLEKLVNSFYQELFPNNNEKIPSIRFNGFINEWNHNMLGKLGNTFSGLSGKTKEDFGHGNAKFVTYRNVYNNPITNINETDYVEIDDKQNQVEFGDVFFTTSSETPEEVGMTSVWLGNTNNIYLNSFCFGYRPLIEINPYYLAFLLRSLFIRKKIMFLAQGISRYNISKNKVMEINIPIPELSEQEQIGHLLKILNTHIIFQQNQLNNLKIIKKSLLNKMFI